MDGINLWAVLASTVASMVIGSIWFGPLFGKQFMDASGMSSWTEEEKQKAVKNMGWAYFGQFIVSLVMFFVLSKFINGSGVAHLVDGVVTGLWVWLGSIVPVKFGDLIWGGNKTLFWLGIGYNLILMVATGAIIGAF